MSILTIVTTLLGIVGGVLGVLKQNNISTGQIGNAAVGLIDTTEADLTNYAAGQAVVVATISVGGKAGVLVAMDDAGTAYQTLFGETTESATEAAAIAAEPETPAASDEAGTAAPAVGEQNERGYTQT